MLKRRGSKRRESTEKERAMKFISSDVPTRRVRADVALEDHIRMKRELIRLRSNTSSWIRMKMDEYTRGLRKAPKIPKNPHSYGYEVYSLNVVVDEQSMIKFRNKLLDDGISLADWVRGIIFEFGRGIEET